MKKTKLIKYVAAGGYMSHNIQDRHTRENNSNNNTNNSYKRINNLKEIYNYKKMNR